MDSKDKLSAKILSGKEVDYMLARARFQDKKIIFTNGCFDILHRGHIEYLLQASKMGNILIIGLNSDLSVKNIKGNNRPIQDQESRARILASLSFVTYIILFDEETPLQLIQHIQPDILVKGGDYKPETIVGYDVVKKKGGKVTTIPFIKGFSTTGLIEKILKL